ncbi:MAG TPA: energy transducer TonB [Steroidobacteraceae bacterium]|jgi:protein TonB|nr:energy transducer TonB [Steroidobacteraceae bacterium]
MGAYAHDTNFFSRRAIVFAAIVVFHVFLVYALAYGLAHKVIQILAPPIQTDIIEEVKERDTPPPPPPPEFERPPVEVPPPEVAIDIPMDTAQSTAITDVTDKPVVHAPPPPPPPRNVVHAKMGKNFPSSEDYYPAASKRLGEEGSITVKVCVGPSGKLSEDPSVTQSSGNARLDEGAIKLAKAGRYVAGSVDGAATTECFPYRIKFELKN